MSARRIVSLLPSATEIVCALGLGDRLVGVTHECDYPAEVAGLPRLTASSLPAPLQTHPGSEPAPALAGRAASIDRHVRRAVHEGSSLYTLDAAMLDALAPDLILTQELCEVCAVSYDIVARAVRRMTGDPRLVSLEPSSLDDVLATMVTVAELAGAPEAGARLVATLRSRLGALQARTATREPVRTLLLEWTDPPMGPGHWTPEVIRLAGGEPVLASDGGNATTLTWEAIAGADPDAIAVAPCGFDLATARGALAELDALPAWRELRAVRKGRAFALDGNAYFNRPGPRLADSAEVLAAALRP